MVNDAAQVAPLIHNEIGDDRDDIRPGDRVLLIVENDAGFARFLLDAAREKGFKGLVTSRGAAALTLTREHNPDVITLDIHLPDIDGWRVLERLKRDPVTRHIPICVISTDDARDRAFEQGSFAFLAKPIQSKDVLDGLLDRMVQTMNSARRRVMVADPALASEVASATRLGGNDIEIVTAPDLGAAAQAALKQEADCLVLQGNQLNSFAERLQSANVTTDGVQMRVPVVAYRNGTGEPASLDTLPQNL